MPSITEPSGYILESIRQDPGFALCRGREDGSPSPVLAVGFAAKQPSPQGLRRLEHEPSLATELDPAWAAEALARPRHEEWTTLILTDPDGQPLDLVLERDLVQNRNAGGAPLRDAADQSGVVLANLPAGPAERRIALVVGLVLLGIGVAVVPFGRIHLQGIAAWVPLITSFLFVADLITWFLLISQFTIVRSPALLVLGSGYGFTAAMNIPLFLTFPGVFSPTGLLGVGFQTGLWLALFWQFGNPLAVIFYAVMKKEPRAAGLHTSFRAAIAASVAIVIAIVLALTWIATAEESHLSKLLPVRYVEMLLLLLTATALLLVWFRRRTVLDQWVMVATCAWLAQEIAKYIHFSGRFSLAFYASSALLVISSTVVLVVLLKETMTLYGRLAVSLVALRQLSAEKLQRSEAYLSEA